MLLMQCEACVQSRHACHRRRDVQLRHVISGLVVEQEAHAIDVTGHYVLRELAVEVDVEVVDQLGPAQRRALLDLRRHGLVKQHYSVLRLTSSAAKQLYCIVCRGGFDV